MEVDFEHPQIFQLHLRIHNYSKSTTLIILENNLDCVYVISFLVSIGATTFAERFCDF